MKVVGTVLIKVITTHDGFKGYYFGKQDIYVYGLKELKTTEINY